jgi:6-phosphofructokinase
MSACVWGSCAVVAPLRGMNSVISASTIEARNSGWDVLGIMDGFEHLIEGRTDEVRPLSITDVSRIHAQGGSIIRTSRANPTVRDEAAADPDWRLHACLEALRKLGIGALVTIGGDDTAFSASRLAQAAGTGLGVVHVPKTIDNDLPLPGGTPTFGFETARSVGVELVNNLMTASGREDAASRSRARTSATSSAARPPSRSTSSTPVTWATPPSTT